MKRFVSLILAALMMFFTCACSANGNGNNVDVRVVVDGGNREVTIPANPQRIAAMSGPSYEMVFMLGGADRIAMTKTGHTTDFPVALLTNPDLSNYAGIGANPNTSVNVEDYLTNNVDLVLYYNNATELKKFDAAGIPSVVAAYSNQNITTPEEYLAMSVEEYIKDGGMATRIVAEVLGGEALEEYEAWQKYNLSVANKIYERTKDISDEDRPTVYWGNTWGENILSTTDIMNHCYDVWLVGGKIYAPSGSGGNFPEITSEQLFDWDPEIIIVDNHGNHPQLVIESMYKENSQWKALTAVKNKQLYRVPTGVFFIDKGTTRALLLLWMATIVQPELFSDIDIIEEIQYYYKEFYEYDLSAEDAQKIINGWYEESEE